MKGKIAKKLQDSGFPLVTRWEIENNYRRHLSVSGEPMLPPLGALLSEFPEEVYVWKSGYYDEKTEKYIASWFATSYVQGGMTMRYYADTEPNREYGCAGKPYIQGYLDGSVDVEYAETPELAVALLYIDEHTKLTEKHQSARD